MSDIPNSPTCIVCDAPIGRSQHKYCKDCSSSMHTSPYAPDDFSSGPMGMVNGSRDVLRIEDYVVPQEIMDRAEMFEELNAQECRRHENKKVRDGFHQMWQVRDLNKKK
jgi:hypothetical protein